MLRTWLLLLCLAPLHAAVPLLTVEDAVRLCLESNFSISLSRYQSAEATVNRQAGIGPFLPDASASLNHTGDFKGNAPQTTVGAQVNLQIFDGFQSYFGYHRLQSQEQSALLAE